ncbi:MAG: hypothetical protein K0R90_1503, partial [Oscillospiraceae bacterium]|nr:hypothetical protein [Oscillospiraceae bacterium]
MNYEYIAIALICIAILIIIVQVFWLYFISVKQESNIKNKKRITEVLSGMIVSVMSAPNQDCLEDEVEQVKDYVRGNILKIDILAELILELITSDEASEDDKRSVVYLYEKVEPIECFIELLKTGTAYEKAYSCLKIAAFSIEDQVPVIKKYIYSGNKDLAYSASMALSVLGDEDSMVEVISICSENYKYSHRIIIEFLDEYTGDLEALAKRVLYEC